MSNILAILMNDVAQLEYDRNKSLLPQHELYLDKMDKQMDEGIQLDNTTIANPDLGERAQFVAGNLANAILNDQEAAAAALCSYLAVRLPDLKQVKINQTGQNHSGEISIEMVFDEDYQKQIFVQLH